MGKGKKGLIIISAINFFEGGPLTILKECLSALSGPAYSEYDVLALVHKKELVNSDNIGDNIKLIQIPNARKSYFFRLYYEYYFFNKIAKKLNPVLWFSLHDITPRLTSVRQAVYCHNAAAFKDVSFNDLFFQPTIFFFTLFYKFLYKININKNAYVIVQQKWLKAKFIEQFKLPKDKILVSHPRKMVSERKEFIVSDDGLNTFFYPALGRPFKNFEILGEAALILLAMNISNFRIVITIDGTENKYTQHIKQKYGAIRQLEFIGKLKLTEVQDYYLRSKALVFPSKLESWGLPITEYKEYNKPIILSDLPYARETTGNYEKASFFNPSDSEELANQIKDLMEGNLKYEDIAYDDDNEHIYIGWDQQLNKLLR